MEPSEANALHAELVAGFFRPPRIVGCGYRGRDGQDVLIVSHVELWPWRTIVRASVTRRGSIATNEGHPDDHTFTDRWLQDWSLDDDVGTRYLPSGAGIAGDGFCRDVEAQFATAVPSTATRLTIHVPTGGRIDIMLT